MRSHILTALAVSALAFAATAPAAQAADLPARNAQPVYAPPPIPVFSWTGFFVGGNAGADFNSGNAASYSFTKGTIAGSTGTAGVLTTNSGNSKVGFTGGGQVGYNYEFGTGGPGLPAIGGLGLGLGGIVLGVVADAQYIDQGNNYGNDYTFSPRSPLTYGNAFVPVRGLPRTNLVTSSTQDDFFGTIRGRLGFALNRALIFGSGGLAYNTHTTGYTYGGGFEYSVTNNISIGAEYLRVNLNRGFGDTAAYTSSGVNSAGTLLVNRFGGNDEFNVARAFLNYRFNNPIPAAAPVVARY